MTVRVERVVEVQAPIEDVWAFIADPEKRARPISVVDDFELDDEDRAIWHIKLPIPVIDRTIRVETEEQVREPPTYVEFVGKSKVMHVVGEHELVEIDGGTRLTNTFIVDGKVPGVERFFKRNMETEFDNLETALNDELGL
ncbi:SRPBCC family protein [Salinibaculum rarum]|uniref:SRPBCC family protein n=1 Tax=Salinibaculum rarum TaxID=3058903 RepID=UPI00265F579C|nr:SRPBCC family protein [Salinibaculum sp. KK48]